MGEGNFFENVFNAIKTAFITFWSYVKDYWNDFVNNPTGFIENHTFVFLAVIFILILIIVLIINLFRSITDRREVKKRKLEKLIAELKEEDLAKIKERIQEEEMSLSATEAVKDVPGEINEIEENVSVETTVQETVDEIIEDIPVEAPSKETINEIKEDVLVEAPIQEVVEEARVAEIEELVESVSSVVPLPTVVNAEEEKEIPMESPAAPVKEKEEEKKPEENIPEYEFIAEVRIINAKEKKEKENIPEVQVEVQEPSFYKDKELNLEIKPEEELNLAFEDEEIDLDFENVTEEKETIKDNSPVFEPIPELRVLEKADINSVEEILYEEEKKTAPEPIVMEKIEVIKVNPAQKFGLKNIDTNRQGKTFTYDELDKLIKD